MVHEERMFSRHKRMAISSAGKIDENLEVLPKRWSSGLRKHSDGFFYKKAICVTMDMVWIAFI
ncbi:hypothetical protein PGB90_008422 [Kerria lacca]